MKKRIYKKRKYKKNVSKKEWERLLENFSEITKYRAEKRGWILAEKQEKQELKKKDEYQIRRLFKTGHSLHKLADKYGVSEKKIKRILKEGKNDIDTSRYAVEQKVDDTIFKKMIKLRKQGYSLAEIGQILNLSKTTVARWLRKKKAQKELSQIVKK